MLVPRLHWAPLAARQDGATTTNSTLAPSSSTVASNVSLNSTDSVSQTSSSSFTSISSSSDSATSSSVDGIVTTSSSTFISSESVSFNTNVISTSSATSSSSFSSSTTLTTTDTDSSSTTSSFSSTSTTFSSDPVSSSSATSDPEAAPVTTSSETQPDSSQIPDPQTQNNSGAPSTDQSSSSAISGGDPSDPPSGNDSPAPAKVDNPIETDSIQSDSVNPTDRDASAGGSDGTDSQGAPAPVSPNSVATPSDGTVPSGTIVAATVAASPTLSPTESPALGPVANPGSDPQPSQPANTANNVGLPSGSGPSPTGLSSSGSHGLATAISLPPTSGIPSSTPVAGAQSSHSAISGGAIAGIVIGVLLVISAVTFMSMMLVRRRLRAQRASLRAAWYPPPSSRRTPPVPSTPTPVREVGRRNTVLNAYGPGQHLPPVQPVTNSVDIIDVAPDPFWDPSDVLPPTVSASKRAPGARLSGYGAGLLGARPMDPFADPITVTAIDARLATDALSEEERASWVDQSGLFFTPSPTARMSQSSPRRVGGFGKTWNRLSDGSSAGHADYRELALPRAM